MSSSKYIRRMKVVALNSDDSARYPCEITFVVDEPNRRVVGYYNIGNAHHKRVVKCAKQDTFDPVVGIALAFIRLYHASLPHPLGWKRFKQWCHQEDTE